jgi:hypothetical protein
MIIRCRAMTRGAQYRSVETETFRSDESEERNPAQEARRRFCGSFFSAGFLLEIFPLRTLSAFRHANPPFPE